MAYYNPDSIEKGEAFQHFVENTLFTKAEYDLVERTHSFQQNANRYIESSRKPDFRFRYKRSGQEFYVEAKFRSYIGDDDKVEIYKNGQYDFHKQLDNKECPVFVIVGVGGQANRPENLSLIPLYEIKYRSLFKSVLYHHRISHGPVSPDIILKYISNFKSTDFGKSTSKSEAFKKKRYLPIILTALTV